MKRFFTTLFFLVLSLTAFSQVEFIYQDVNKAITEAEKEKRYIMVDVTADWCGWCKKMDATTFKNKEVAAYLKNNLVAVKVNTQQSGGRAFADKYKVRGLPTIVYLDYEGNLMKSVPGFKTAKQLLLDLKPYELKNKKLTEDTDLLNNYFKAREPHISNLRSKLMNSNTNLSKSFSFGETRNSFEFDKLKYLENTKNGREMSTTCDIFYFLGTQEFKKALDKLSTIKNFTIMSALESEFLVSTLAQHGMVNENMLALINEKTTKTSDLKLLETKALIQFLVGDMKDANSTLKALKKKYKKGKLDLDTSVLELEKLFAS